MATVLTISTSLSSSARFASASSISTTLPQPSPKWILYPGLTIAAASSAVINFFLYSSASVETLYIVDPPFISASVIRVCLFFNKRSVYFTTLADSYQP